MINTIYSKQGYTILQNYTILYNIKQGWWVGVSVRRTNDTARAAALCKSAPAPPSQLEVGAKTAHKLITVA